MGEKNMEIAEGPADRSRHLPSAQGKKKNPVSKTLCEIPATYVVKDHILFKTSSQPTPVLYH